MHKRILGLLLVGLLSPAVYSDDVLGKVIQIKSTEKGVSSSLQYQHKSQPTWFAGYIDMKTQLHDKFRTNEKTAAVLEFLLGGRVGINLDSEVEIVTERSVKDVNKTTKRIILRKGGIWAKASHLKEPLEIQTNGGILGIKGTEFVIDSQPGGQTSVAVLEGAVEVTDSAGRVIGQAKPGDEYLISFQQVATVNSYGSSEENVSKLRNKLLENDWKLFNDLFDIAKTISSYQRRLAVVESQQQDFQAWEDYRSGKTTEKPPEPPLKSNLDSIQEKLNRLNQLNKPSRSEIDEMGSYTGEGSSIAKSQVVDRNDPNQQEHPTQLSPDGNQGQLTGNHPVFKWKGLPEADGYVLLVSRDREFRNLEWSSRTQEAAAAYPNNANSLAKGRHYWRVIAVDRQDQPLLGKKGAQAYFEVGP
jgi:hypothetical protein